MNLIRFEQGKQELKYRTTDRRQRRRNMNLKRKRTLLPRYTQTNENGNEKPTEKKDNSRFNFKYTNESTKKKNKI